MPWERSVDYSDFLSHPTYWEGGVAEEWRTNECVSQRRPVVTVRASASCYKEFRSTDELEMCRGTSKNINQIVSKIDIGPFPNLKLKGPR